MKMTVSIKVAKKRDGHQNTKSRQYHILHQATIITNVFCPKQSHANLNVSNFSAHGQNRPKALGQGCNTGC